MAALMRASRNLRDDVRDGTVFSHSRYTCARKYTRPRVARQNSRAREISNYNLRPAHAFPVQTQAPVRGIPVAQVGGRGHNPHQHGAASP